MSGDAIQLLYAVATVTLNDGGQSQMRCDINGNAKVALQVGASPAGATNPIPVSQVAQASGGYPFSSQVLSAANTNATLSKGSAGQVFCVSLGNSSTTAAFLKLYNKASAPLPGTDTPIATYMVPGSGVTNINFPAGKMFTTGISYALTGLAANTDTTAVLANQICGSIEFA